VKCKIALRLCMIPPPLSICDLPACRKSAFVSVLFAFVDEERDDLLGVEKRVRQLADLVEKLSESY
jgi:hypothetical protein